jgi:hypothetical protein
MGLTGPTFDMESQGLQWAVQDKAEGGGNHNLFAEDTLGPTSSIGVGLSEVS